MIQVTMDSENKILSMNTYYTKTVVVDFDINDTLVVEDWVVIKIQDSQQWKDRVRELQEKKELDEFEKQEIKFLSSETQSEKETDKKEAQEIILSGQYIVNISSKGKKKIATIFDAKTANADGVEFDAERWDINTESIDVAEKYKSIVESEGLNAAMERFKSL